MRSWKNIEFEGTGGGITEEGWSFWESSLYGNNDTDDDEDFTHLADVRIVAEESENTVTLKTHLIYKEPEAKEYEPVSSRVQKLLLEEQDRLLKQVTLEIENHWNEEN